MKLNSRSKNNTLNSYFLIDKLNKIISFNIDHFANLERILLKKPQIGQVIDEIIPHNTLTILLKPLENALTEIQSQWKGKLKFMMMFPPRYNWYLPLLIFRD